MRSFYWFLALLGKWRGGGGQVSVDVSGLVWFTIIETWLRRVFWKAKASG